MDLVEKVERYVEESFRDSSLRDEESRQTDISHSKNTLHWARELYPESGIGLQIAALAHDIDRAFDQSSSDALFYAVNERLRESNRKQLDYDDRKKMHMIACADIIGKYLKQEEVGYLLLEEISRLVLHHETGGFFEADVLSAADSISFLDNNFQHYLRKHGKEKARFKVEWTYGRLKQIPDEGLRERALKAAQPLYERALEALKP